MSNEPWCDDLYIALRAGEMDLEMLLSLMSNENTITLESPMIKESLLKDIKIIKNIMSY